MKNVFKVMLILATVYCTQSLAKQVDVKDTAAKRSHYVDIDESSTNSQLYQAVSDETGQPVGRIKLIYKAIGIPKDDNIVNNGIFMDGIMMVIKHDVSPVSEAVRLEQKEFEITELNLALARLQAELEERDRKIAELEEILNSMIKYQESSY